MRCRIGAVQGLGLASVIVSAMFVGAASAGDELPQPTLVCMIAGCPIDIDPWTCGEVRPLDDGRMLFRGRHVVDGLLDLQWSMVASNVIVDVKIVVSQFTGATQTFALGAFLPYSSPGTSCIGGSVIGAAVDGGGDGVTMSVPEGSWFYQAMVDGMPIPEGSLLPGPQGVTGGSFEAVVFGPDHFGSPIPSLPVGPIQTSVGAILNLSLTSGDVANVTGILTAEPCGAAAAQAGANLVQEGER